MLADYDPVRARKIRETCTLEDIAESYKSKMTGAYGVGYKHKGD